MCCLPFGLLALCLRLCLSPVLARHIKGPEFDPQHQPHKSTTEQEPPGILPLCSSKLCLFPTDRWPVYVPLTLKMSSCLSVLLSMCEIQVSAEVLASHPCVWKFGLEMSLLQEAILCMVGYSAASRYMPGGYLLPHPNDLDCI